MAANPASDGVAVFALRGRLFGLELNGIRAIYPWLEPSWLPRMPAFIRGMIMPPPLAEPVLLIDPCPLLDLGRLPNQGDFRIIIICSGEKSAGLIAEGEVIIKRSTGADRKDFDTLPEDMKQRYIMGAYSLKSRLVPLINPDIILSPG